MTPQRNREAGVPAKPRRGDRRTDRAPSGAQPPGPRTLAEELRTWSDDDLAALLRARPDLLSPVPGDLTRLATRAGTRASVVRALERLDRFARQTAEALAVAPDPCPYATLLGLMAGDAGGEERKGPEEPQIREDVSRELPRAVATLRGQALVWGGEDRLRLVRTAREVLAPGTPGASGAGGLSSTGLGPTVAEATAGMSPGRLQEIIAAAGLPATHDPVTAVEALTALFTDPARMAALLAEAPEESRATLDRLIWGPPYGTVPAEPSAPIRWLMARGLLLPMAPGTVVLPREVALHLRGGRTHRVPEPVPPAVVPAREHPPRTVDVTAAGQAFTALATIEDLLREWDLGGPAVLRAGGLSMRDLKRAAAALDTDEPTAAFWLELAYAAGLIASDGDAEERFAATPAYDEWSQRPAEERWAALVTVWLRVTRTPGVVGTQDAKGRTLAALGSGIDRAQAPSVRRRTLELLTSLPEGGSADPDTLLARLRWEHGGAAATAPGSAAGAAGPGGSRTQAPAAAARSRSAATRVPVGQSAPSPSFDDLRSRLARWTLTEAELLGITGRGALSSHGRALLEPLPAAEDPAAGQASADPARRPFPSPDETAAAAARAAGLLAPLLPRPVDHVLLQADLTAVAPGPLERPLAKVLGMAADIESKGGATVYRFTPGSVRRALDAGQTATDLQAFLTRNSRTPVPQPLSYLIDDVARKHGHLRVGAASAYVRCDDDALLAEIVADRRSAGLRLRRLAPTVLAAQAPPDLLLERLREMGYAPAAESAEGDVVVKRADSLRTPPRTAPAPVQGGPPLPDDTLLSATVKAIRAGDLAATAGHKPDGATAAAGASADRGSLPRTTSAETLAIMQAAVLTGTTVWIGYVNADGAASQRVIAPVRVEGGSVTVYDHTADEVRTFPLHRITGASQLADNPPRQPPS